MAAKILKFPKPKKVKKLTTEQALALFRSMFNQDEFADIEKELKE